ncbi:LexA family protein [Salisaeta longa]|uniref:LexA family protein n=1 Tax=Salisaeta longa TaxID=503170 RepID=UPI0003B55F7C|nr:translesion error-prone DNA polymerase V autoproteolytic subunit [Salisaeta longa]
MPLLASSPGPLRLHGLAHPLFLSTVPAGFPNPADDYVETALDLNEYLTGGRPSVFYVRVRGDSMTGAGIHDGDLLVVDRAPRPRAGDVVIAALDGDLTVKRYEVRRGQPYLVPESPHHAPIRIADGQDLMVWGVVQHAIHAVS